MREPALLYGRLRSIGAFGTPKRLVGA